MNPEESVRLLLAAENRIADLEEALRSLVEPTPGGMFTLAYADKIIHAHRVLADTYCRLADKEQAG